AVIAVAFAAIGLSRHDSTRPVGTTTSAPSTTVAPVRFAVVPDVLGMTRASARSVLVSLGFGTVDRFTTSCVAHPAGQVVVQTPAAGTRARVASVVTITSCSSPAPPVATTTLQVFRCSTQHGVPPSSPPSTPTSIVVATPPFQSPGLAGFTDDDGRLVTTAPPFWGCKALDATDGGATIDLTLPDSPTSKAYDTGQSRNPGTDGVFAISIPTCQGCVYSEICAVVPSANADFPSFAGSGLCRTPPAGEHVTKRGNNVYVIDDPAGTLGPDPARSILRYTPKTSTTDASVIRETCILRAADHTICDTLLDEFLALNPART
ncbi:MAG TPA: PASTA domain-containing protein, partial [Acidimicrobiia bacterium]